MIIGIGSDIIEINRIDKAKNQKGFIDKLFTECEKSYIESRLYSTETIAGIFAAKEAVSKALGTGIRGFSFKDIEIIKDENGKPIVKLYNNADKIAKGLCENYLVHITISHSKENAIAFSILENRD